MTNQEILDLGVESINRLIFDMGTLIEKNYPPSPGRIQIYSHLEPFFPEYIQSSIGTVPYTTGQASGTISVDDFAFLVSGLVTITSGGVTQYRDCVPVTFQYLTTAAENGYAEEGTTPFITLGGGLGSGQAALTVSFQGSPFSDPSDTIGFLIRYIARQEELLVSGSEDIPLSPRFFNRIMDDMILNYEKLKQMQAQ